MLTVGLVLLAGCSGNLLRVESPDGNIIVTLSNDGILSYSVTYQGQEIIAPSKLGLEFRDHGPMNEGLKVLGTEKSNHDSQWERVWGRDKIVRDHYQELVVHLADAAEAQFMDVIIRAYDDGVGIRYHLPEQANIGTFELTSDNTEYAFTGNHTVWAAHYGSFKSHQESEFREMNLDDPRMEELTATPLLVRASEDRWVALSEANLTDWAGMYVQKSGSTGYTIKTVLSPYPDDPELLVRSETPRNSPWRMIMIGNSPGRFIESDLLANLNDPNVLEDVSWIRPGKSAWDWWWSNCPSPDVDFKWGVNTETQKYFVDLAAEMGWEYQLVDWLWYGPAFLPIEGDANAPHPESNMTTCIPEIDVPEIVKYAGEKGVKTLVWLEWNHADRQMEEAFPLFEKWGVAGVKVDFMQRDDQYVVNFYHRLVKLAARHHLVVDFHGAYKPTGVSRTWPNLMTREGVLGNEYTKWSDRITPEHKVTIPFTRGMLGEMDFTPGAWVNVMPENHRLQNAVNPDLNYPGPFPSPVTMGTRCNEMAMLVVFDSPLQVLCDAPHNYRNSPAGTDFLKIVPTTWDETLVLNAAVGDYITTARRTAGDWYIGSMTDMEARTLTIPLDFLDEGTYVATVWKDAADSFEHPTHLDKEIIEVDRSSVIEAVMTPGGGNVIHLTKKL